MIFRILAKNVANITKASFHLSRLTSWQKKILEKMSSTLAEFQGKNVRISSGKCEEEFSEGTNFAKRVIRIIFDFGKESFKLFPKNCQESRHNGSLRIQRTNSRKKNLEVYSSLFFSDTAQKFLDFMRWVFCRFIKYAFYSPKGSFWEKVLFEIGASHSRISSDNRCGFIAQNFSIGLPNLNPKCPDHPISEENMLEYLPISLFLDYEQ